MAKDTGVEVEQASSGVDGSRNAIGKGLLQLQDCSDATCTDDWSRWWQSFLRGAQLPSPRDARKLRCVDLFCGAGGFALGASLAARGASRRPRFERIVDADGRAMRVHASSLDVGRSINSGVSSLVDYQIRRRSGGVRFSYTPEVVDNALAIEPDVDLLIAGPPCQGHSNLNNYTRRADPRNDLFICTVAAAIALKTKVVIIENVRTVTVSSGDVVGMARELFEASGYVVNEDIVRADVLGWPQTRERFFMTAVRQDLACAELPPFRIREPNSVLWAISDLMDLDVTRGPFDTAPVSGAENRSRIDWLFDNGQYNLDNSERPDCHKDGTTYTAVYGRMFEDRPAPTITTGIGTPGQGRFIHPLRRRLITPHEAARIQGFPDGYAFLDETGKATRKDLAKWIGDAVPSVMGFEIVSRALASAGIAQMSNVER